MAGFVLLIESTEYVLVSASVELGSIKTEEVGKYLRTPLTYKVRADGGEKLMAEMGLGFTTQIVESLQQSLDISRVKSRRQQGQDVSYLESWDVIDAANNIFGFDQWTTRIVDVKVEDLGIWAIVEVKVRGVTREDVGFNAYAVAEGKAPTKRAMETSLKGAVSDAMKTSVSGLSGRNSAMTSMTKRTKIEPITRDASVTATGNPGASGTTGSPATGRPVANSASPMELKPTNLAEKFSVANRQSFGSMSSATILIGISFCGTSWIPRRCKRTLIPAGRRWERLTHFTNTLRTWASR